MRGPTQILEILRDFVEVHRLVADLAIRHRSSGLRFEALAGLIEDDEGSVLFRLKERTHSRFRAPRGEQRAPTHREALFDLAVGSLFHEAMKLRENLYQREIYGPQVRALLSDAEEESKALFDEFEKMLGSVEERVDEGVHELETLVQRTAEQLRLLIAEPPDDGATRFMTERPEQVQAVFGVSVADQLEVMYGSVATGFERAGRSYLASGFFAKAAQCFERALERDMSVQVAGLRDYARGMQAYVARDYAASVEHLAAWASAGPPDTRLRGLARDAVSSIVQLAEGDDRTRISREAAELRKALSTAPPADAAGASD
jgi:tetratricopeptide (TPR) repeat protein